MITRRSIIVSLIAFATTCATPTFAQDNAALNEIEHAINGSSSSRVDPKALQQLASVLRNEPKSARAHYLLGRAYEHLGFTDMATQEYDLADKLAPNGPNELFDQFADKVTNGDVRGALQYYNYIRDRFPDDPILMLMDAQLCQKRGQVHEIDFYLERALNMPMRDLGLPSAAGELRLTQKRYAEALKLAQEDLAKNPDHFRGNAVAGLACMRMHRYDEGAQYIRKALTVRASDRNLNREFCQALINAGMYADALTPGLIYMAQCTETGSLDAAKQRVKNILGHLSPKEAQNIAAMTARMLSGTAWEARMNLALGDVFDRLGWLADAEAHYERGLELDGTVTRAYYRLAVDEQRSGKYVAALRLYSRAYHRDPQNPEIQLATARLMERLGNRRNDLAWRLKDAARGVPAIGKEH